MKKHTNLASLLRTDPRIDKFLNISIPTSDFFLHQLNNIDNAACSWRAMLSGISLNVFQGFAGEQQLVDYVVNQAYYDNVSVFASKFISKHRFNKSNNLVVWCSLIITILFSQQNWTLVTIITLVYKEIEASTKIPVFT